MDTTTRRIVLRGAGMLLLWAGGTVLLYVVWLLWFTGATTAQAQQTLLDEFVGFEPIAGVAAADGPLDDEEPGGDDEEPGGDDEGGRSRAVVPVGDGVAVIEFERPGDETAPVLADPVVVVAGTSVAALRRGPGHYLSTTGPGGAGNFAVAGHRTTYGAPFHDLQALLPDDLVHVWDRDGARHTYRVVAQPSQDEPRAHVVVRPDETWVLGDDPMGTGGATLTLTTCHPRYSAASRLVVFAELVSST